MRGQGRQGGVVLPVGAGAVDRLLTLAEAFHREGGHPLQDSQRQAIRRLVAEPELGRAWILAGKHDDLGYATCAFTYSVDAGSRAVMLDDLYVVPRARGRGLGRLLMTELEDDLVGQCVHAIVLMADGGDRRTRHFYERIGFSPTPLVTFSKTLGNQA